MLLQSLGIIEAFQGVLATSYIAKKCGENLFLIHRQPTKADRKRATICDSSNPFLLSTKRHVFALLFSTATLLPVAWSLCDHAKEPLQVDKKDDKPYNFCHAVGLLFPVVVMSWYKVGSCVGASLPFPFPCAKCESSSLSSLVHRCLSRATFSARQIFFHFCYGKT